MILTGLSNDPGPVLYSCIWFAVFGGAGLRMERQVSRSCADAYMRMLECAHVLPAFTSVIAASTLFPFFSLSLSALSPFPHLCPALSLSPGLNARMPYACRNTLTKYAMFTCVCVCGARILGLQAIQDGCLGKCQIVYAGATFDDRLCKVDPK